MWLDNFKPFKKKKTKRCILVGCARCHREACWRGAPCHRECFTRKCENDYTRTRVSPSRAKHTQLSNRKKKMGNHSKGEEREKKSILRRHHCEWWIIYWASKAYSQLWDSLQRKRVLGWLYNTLYNKRVGKKSTSYILIRLDPFGDEASLSVGESSKRLDLYVTNKNWRMMTTVRCWTPSSKGPFPCPSQKGRRRQYTTRWTKKNGAERTWPRRWWNHLHSRFSLQTSFLLGRGAQVKEKRKMKGPNPLCASEPREREDGPCMLILERKKKTLSCQPDK